MRRSREGESYENGNYLSDTHAGCREAAGTFLVALFNEKEQNHIQEMLLRIDAIMQPLNSEVVDSSTHRRFGLDHGVGHFRSSRPHGIVSWNNSFG